MKPHFDVNTEPARKKMHDLYQKRRPVPIKIKLIDPERETRNRMRWALAIGSMIALVVVPLFVASISLLVSLKGTMQWVAVAGIFLLLMASVMVHEHFKVKPKADEDETIK